MGTFYVPTTEDGWTFGGAWIPGTLDGFMQLALDGSNVAAFRLTNFPVNTATGTSAGSQTSSSLSTTTTVFQTFSFVFTGQNSPTGTLTMSIMPTNQPQAFSNSNLPVMGPVMASFTGTFPTGQQTIVIPATRTGIGAINPVYRSGGWNGALAFVMQWVGSGNLDITSASGAGTTLTAIPQLQTTGDYSIDTGRDGDMNGMGRMDRCPRCGMISNREEWILDGFYKRLVCTRRSCWDPEDEAKWPIRVPYEKPPINNQG